MESIEIKQSKPKLALLLIISIAFVVGGYFMIVNPIDENAINPLSRNRIFVSVMGYISVIFFGLCGVVFLMQLLGINFQKREGFKKGITVDEYGITDNSNINSVGLIPWEDVNEIKISTVLGRKRFLTIIVKNPEDYINAQKTLKVMKGMRNDMNITGSPINILTGTFSMNIDKLKLTMDTKLKEFKQKQIAFLNQKSKY